MRRRNGGRSTDITVVGLHVRMLLPNMVVECGTGRANDCAMIALDVDLLPLPGRRGMHGALMHPKVPLGLVSLA